MGDHRRAFSNLPPEQQAIREKCRHPNGAFAEFEKNEIEQSIPDRFERQVRSHSERIAVRSRKHALSYDQLNRAANRIARAILAQCGETEKPVALLIENDVGAIAAILGILKAGKFYVPLDPSHPGARTRTILEDSQASLLLTNRLNLPLARELQNDKLPLINTDDLDPGLSDENLGLSISPDALSRIRYTSGSTGEPKGVFQNHRNVLCYTMHYNHSFHIGSEDRINAGVHDLFNALLNSASLYVFDVKEEGLAGLTHWLTAQRITIFFCVPAVFYHFLDTLGGGETFPDLRLIVLEGEAVPKQVVKLYQKHFPADCILVNKLGARETGGICQYFIDGKTEIESAAVPSGYAVEDKEILLLDESGKELAPGQTGEIAIKSLYLALGYWRRPELSKTKFLQDPNGSERIYLTGDLGLMRPDGCLLHIGRKDFQVKVRGNRVEVEEIERALLEYSSIKEAAVVARVDPRGETRLLAYAISHANPQPTATDFRRFLQQKLPEYMIPSAFVLLDALPRTVNGKIDRNALPAPPSVRPDLENAFAAPRTPVEESLARIWAGMLGIDEVGIHDNFLDLGGHSLLATRIISRVINEFRVELPLQSLFAAPTVAEMAVVITQNQAKRASEEDLARMLSDLEALSDEEAHRLAAEKDEETGKRRI